MNVGKFHVYGEESSKGQKIPRGDEIGEFPSSKKELLKFDLILFGEVTSEEFSIEEQNWIVDFVTQRAGGILFIDGPRQKLRSFQNQEQYPVSKLFPVSWRKKGPLLVSPTSYIRPQKENRLSALTMDPVDERNEEVWKHPAASCVGIFCRVITRIRSFPFRDHQCCRKQPIIKKSYSCDCR